MTLARAVAILYWTAVIVFVVGVALRLVAGGADIGVLHVPGEILNGVAWPIAAAAAVIDVSRRQRREDVHEAHEHADAAPPAA